LLLLHANGIFLPAPIAPEAIQEYISDDDGDQNHPGESRLSHRFGFAVNNLFLPVKAADFLDQHGLTGRILNHLDFGGYLINRFPTKVYIDGRNEVMGEDLGREFLETKTRVGLQRLAAKYQPGSL